jgi:hypothetical protein
MEKMKRNVSEKMMLKKQIKNKKGDDKKNRFLVSVNFLGSAGPIRFVVNGDDLVSGVIDTALKTYARGGRLPVLGFDVNKFLLYCANPPSDGIFTSPFLKISQLFFIFIFIFIFCLEFFPYSLYLILILIIASHL